MTRPVWLLDVDGVLNVDVVRDGPVGRGTARAGGVDWPFRWSLYAVEALRRLIEADVVDVTWCTTWCAQADEVERLLGLPPLPRAWTNEAARVARKFKLTAAREVVASGRRLVWTDDDCVPLRRDPLYRELTATPGQSLLIRPDGRYGLHPADLRRISEFIYDGVSGEPVALPSLV